MQIGHNRQEPEGGPDAPMLVPAQERLSMDTLLKGYTLDGAYQLRMDNRLGSIEVGKTADLIVLSQNIFEIDRYQIAETEVDMTIKDGAVVFERTLWVNLKEQLMEWLY